MGTTTNKENKVSLKELAKKLVGHEIVLDPVQSAMFVDPVSKITLSYFDGQSDRCEIDKDMNLIKVLESISKGILRVFKGTKDVTNEFGGNKINTDWRRTKLVDEAPKMAISPDKSDKALIALLNNNNTKEVCRNLSTVSDLSQLERINDLEMLGKNPSFQSRAVVVDYIKDKIKGMHGVGMARKMDEEKSDVVTVK